VTEHIIASAEQVTPEWLTAVLRQRGCLPRGRVTAVIAGPARGAFGSSAWRLQVSYSPNAAPSAPQGLFLKASQPEQAPGQFDVRQLAQEARFYEVIAPLMAAPFTIPCYDATWQAETGASHVLLKDVSATHAADRDPLHRGHAEQAIDCLARLHAFWWDHPRLGQDIGSLPSWEERQQDIRDTVESAVAFMAALGDDLLPRWRRVYERVLPALPDLFRRQAAGRNLTLIHGDAHLGNFLFPKDDQAGGAYLADWQFWHLTIGGADLAFMMAAEWESETRRRLEHGLLRRYHNGLLAHGVQGYAWQQCWDDYRLSVIQMSLFIPVWRWSVFRWTPDLAAVARSMTAFEELECLDLISEQWL
jgi:aminoglycoside phosphotransferase (APT) family kinase protein